MSLSERIKSYFAKKDAGDESAKAPEGMCPNCWGHNEWDGEYFKIVRDKHLTPGSHVYDSFISKVVDKHVSTTHKHKNQYICITCDTPIV